MAVLVVAGTRPEAIKLAPVITALRAAGLPTQICATGQHPDLLDQAFEGFQLVPDLQFDLHGTTPDLDTRLEAISRHVGSAISAGRPDWVVVQGDTTTALAAAVAAYSRGIAVAHVEAGLRTFDFHAPWPEERNRCMITSLAKLHFTPTARASYNLEKERVDRSRIELTGNTGVDALAAMRRRLASDAGLRATASRELAGLPIDRRLIFLTAHRRESHGPGLARVAEAIRRLATRGDVEMVLATHPNPGAGSFAATLCGTPGIRLVPPLSYAACVTLMERVALIITDSGGLQEEAPSLGVPLLVTRAQTERPEAIEAGAALLVGTDPARIEIETSRLLDDQAHHAAMAQVRTPFGDGKAAPRIAARLALELSGMSRAA